MNIMKVFKVAKKSGFDRLVMDATPINTLSIKAPPMELSTIHSFFEGLLKHKFAFSVDAKAFFYQFMMDAEVSKFFGIAINRRRGHPFYANLKRLCMGWRMAPAIAQRTSRTLILETRRRLSEQGILDYFGDVWLDNFIFAANSAEEALAVKGCFDKVATDIHLQLHPPSTIDTNIDVLGFHICLLTKSVRHQQKWLDKTADRLEKLRSASAPTFRELAAIIGNTIWSMYARRRPISTVPSILEALRAMACCTPPTTWESPAGHLLNAALLAELWCAQHAMEQPFNVITHDCLAQIIFSDAATGYGRLPMWAFVTDEGSTAGFFSDPSEHIFFLELRAALQALLSEAKLNPCQTTILGMDNTAAMFALRSGHSGNSKADHWLRTFFLTLPKTFKFYVSHIRTQFNPADPFTRGVPPDNWYLSTQNNKGQTTEACQRIPITPRRISCTLDQGSHSSKTSVFSFSP